MCTKKKWEYKIFNSGYDQKLGNIYSQYKSNNHENIILKQMKRTFKTLHDLGNTAAIVRFSQ